MGEVQQAVKYSSLLSYMLKPSFLITKRLKKIRSHRRSSSSICLILGHGESGGVGE